MKHSVTSYNTARKCQRAWYITYIMGIKPSGKNNAFALGSGFHKAIEMMISDLTRFDKLKDREHYIDIYRKTVLGSKDLEDPAVVDTYMSCVSSQHMRKIPKAFNLNGKLLLECWLGGKIEGEDWCGKPDVFSDKNLIFDHKTGSKFYTQQEIDEIDGPRFQMLTLSWMIHDNFGLKTKAAFWNQWLKTPIVDHTTGEMIQNSVFGFNINWDEVEAAKWLFTEYVKRQREMMKQTAEAGDWKLVFKEADECPDRFCPHRGSKFCTK
jgi:hypothetical protein